MRSPKQVLMLLSARHVRRFHTSQFIGEQTVADHSWGVAAIVAYLMDGADRTRMCLSLLAALHHDVPEKWLGDVPANVKGDAPLGFGEATSEAEERVLLMLGYPMVPLSISEDLRRVVFLADKLDLMHTVSGQLALGNTTLEGIFLHAQAAILHEIPLLLPESRPAAARASALLSAIEIAYNAAALARSGKMDVELLAKLRQDCAEDPTDGQREG
jgi:5'-deoxynucleotidase YfbR-like HD superfamily hydrolase